MERQNEKQNGFGSGFVVGLLFGVVLTLLLVTKKGRKLLHTLTEEGLGNVKGLRERLKDADIAIDEDLYYDDLEQETSSPAPVSVKEQRSEEPKQVHNGNGVKKTAKKFFRGIPKKSSS
ncbi:MAG: hypothetical protein Q8Q49_01590 [bacterium]|nr:hypothetical protein [bacterium]